MSSQEIVDLEQEIAERIARLNALRKANSREPVPNYAFHTLSGEVSLLDLFGDREQLLAIHNMGQGCRYCTLWADGFNGLLPHLESIFSVVLLSKDPPETQRRFANVRGWRFHLASHGGSNYLQEQNFLDCGDLYAGAVLYERESGQVFRKNACVFGPGDLYCAFWSLAGLAGLGEKDWTPQYAYWLRPEKLDDGGANLLG